MPELIPPPARLHAAWLEAHAERGPGQHEDGFGLRPSDEVRSAAGFAAWLARLPSARRRGLGSWALGEILDEARAVSLDRALLVCAVDNLASAKTIARRS
jgi:hypothetical protein